MGESAHFNHKLRGEESQRDADFVRQHCRELQIPLSMGQGDVAAYAQSHGLGTEEAARILRYDYLESLSPDAKIATAHNAQDNLETMLIEHQAPFGESKCSSSLAHSMAPSTRNL